MYFRDAVTKAVEILRNNGHIVAATWAPKYTGGGGTIPERAIVEVIDRGVGWKFYTDPDMDWNPESIVTLALTGKPGVSADDLMDDYGAQALLHAWFGAKEVRALVKAMTNPGNGK
jgi:hypothetical protein